MRSDIQEKTGKETVIPGMEPTGHYWFNLALFLRDNGIQPVLVNPLHVKRSKELDDHLPSKNDMKDPKTIAKLVIEGRYVNPYLPEGIYAEIRNASNMRFQIETELTRNKNRIQRWFAIYFPEYTEVYGSFDAISSMMILRQAALPCDIINLGADRINQIWRDAKLRAVGKKRAQTLVDAAQRSIGYTKGPDTARFEMTLLLEDYDRLQSRLKQITELIEKLVRKVPYAEKLLQIKGIGMKTVSGFIAEVGDISRFTDAKQIQKLAGQAIVENSSGKADLFANQLLTINTENGETQDSIWNELPKPIGIDTASTTQNDGNKWIVKPISDFIPQWENVKHDTHTIKMFYMERGGCYSNLAMEMDLPTVKSLTISKSVDYQSHTTDYFDDTEYEFQIYEKIIDATTGEEEWVIPTDIESNFKLKANGRKQFDNIGRERIFKVVELSVNPQIYDLVSVNGSHTVLNPDAPLQNIESTANAIGNVSAYGFSNRIREGAQSFSTRKIWEPALANTDPLQNSAMALRQSAPEPVLEASAACEKVIIRKNGIEIELPQDVSEQMLLTLLRGLREC